MLALAHAWHERVLADPVVSHAFSHGFRDDHTERLAAYWAEVLGGPATYSQTMGDEAHVVRLHTGNGPHDEMDRRAVDCFAAALAGRRGAAEAPRGAGGLVPRRQPVRQPPLRLARRRAGRVADAGGARPESELVAELRDRGREQLGHPLP